MKKFIKFFFVTTFLVFLSSSMHAEIKFSDFSAAGNFSKSDSLGPVLYRLYIDNSGVGPHSNTPFQKLINAGNHKLSKVVFQFYFENGKITLIAFPGPINHHKDFDTTLQIKLNIFDPCPNDSIIDGKLVSFADLEIKNEHAQAINNEINQIANNSKFIIFIPYLEINGDVTTINYSIVGSDTKEKTAVCAMAMNKFKTAVNINPSPPRKLN